MHRAAFPLLLARVGTHHVLLPFRLAGYFAAGSKDLSLAYSPTFKGGKGIYHEYHVSFIMSGNEICGGSLRE